MLAGRFSRVGDPVCSTFGDGSGTCSTCQSMHAFGNVKGGLQGSRNHAATGCGIDTNNARSGRKEKIITGKGHTEGKGGEKFETTMPLHGFYALPVAQKVVAAMWDQSGKQWADLREQQKPYGCNRTLDDRIAQEAWPYCVSSCNDIVSLERSGGSLNLRYPPAYVARNTPIGMRIKYRWKVSRHNHRRGNGNTK